MLLTPPICDKLTHLLRFPPSVTFFMDGPLAYAANQQITVGACVHTAQAYVKCTLRVEERTVLPCLSKLIYDCFKAVSVFRSVHQI